MGTRLLLLLSLSWVMDLKDNLFTVLGEDVSGRDLVLFGGGLFLLTRPRARSSASSRRSEELEEEQRQAAQRGPGALSGA
jgi:predicted tellurium resistance membrane protein TerC